MFNILINTIRNSNYRKKTNNNTLNGSFELNEIDFCYDCEYNIE